MVADFIIDSLRYWSGEMGVDGFRFDLAPVLGNCRSEGGFEYNCTDPGNVLNRMVAELPVRDAATLAGVDLVAEPWATGVGNTYQLGRFPDGWAEWNDVYRKCFREAENKLHVIPLPPAPLANAFAGSEQQFRNTGPRLDPRPYQSINYIASHDGYTLRDLFSYTNDDQEAWDHGGNARARRQAMRNAFAVLMLSAGTPMFMGGDEFFRTQGGQTNTVAVDDPSVYLNWEHFQQYARALEDNDAAALARLQQEDDIRTYEFTRNLLRFRQRYPSLRPARYFTGLNVNGLKDIAWLRSDGSELSGNDWGDRNNLFLAFRVDNRAYLSEAGVASIYVAYNRDAFDVALVLPENLAMRRWFRVVDTDEWMEDLGNFENDGTMLDRSYTQHKRSLLILIEK